MTYRPLSALKSCETKVLGDSETEISGEQNKGSKDNTRGCWQYSSVIKSLFQLHPAAARLSVMGFVLNSLFPSLWAPKLVVFLQIAMWQQPFADQLSLILPHIKHSLSSCILVRLLLALLNLSDDLVAIDTPTFYKRPATRERKLLRFRVFLRFISHYICVALRNGYLNFLPCLHNSFPSTLNMEWCTLLW